MAKGPWNYGLFSKGMNLMSICKTGVNIKTMMKTLLFKIVGVYLALQ